MRKQAPERTARRPIGAAVRAIGVRLMVVVVAATVLAWLWFGDVAWLLPPRSAPPPIPPEAEPADPGWPHRRGPKYDAVSAEAGLLDAWPPEGPPVLWIREPGRGYSGLIAVGDRVFTQTQSLSAQYVVCLDADSGGPIWRHRYGWPYEAAGMYPGPRATPTWHAGRVYFAGPRGLVGCLRASDGGLIWSVNVNQEFGGRGTDFGYACCPLVEDGKVVLPVGGEGAGVVALDARDGSTVWASGDEPASYCSAIPITLRGRRCVVAFVQNALTLFDLGTGRLLWREKYSRGYDEHAAAPLYDEPLLMVASPFQSGAECYRLETGGSEGPRGRPPDVSATPAWDTGELSNDTASSVLVDGYVYGFDLRDVQAKAHRPSRGTFKCLDFTTGRVCWETDRTGHATVIAADGKLILFNDRGEVRLARASPDGYRELACAEVFSGEICWTAPSLHRGRLYLRSPSKAACLYLGKPESLAEGRLAAARPTSEIPKSARLDLTRLVGGERRYAFDPADLPELGRWYGFSLLGVLAVAAVLAAAVDLPVRRKRPVAAGRAGRVVFWGAAFALGVAGTPLFNRLGQHFIFTWPVCLFVAHQVALMAIVWAGRQPRGWRSKGVSWLALVFFLGVCLAYFLACRRLSMAVEWVFLLGFLPSWPIAVPAAYRLQAPGHAVRDFLWSAFCFSAYFWAGGGFLLWKAAAL